jgi:hypothetical protein
MPPEARAGVPPMRVWVTTEHQTSSEELVNGGSSAQSVLRTPLVIGSPYGRIGGSSTNWFSDVECLISSGIACLNDFLGLSGHMVSWYFIREVAMVRLTGSAAGFHAGGIARVN